MDSTERTWKRKSYCTKVTIQDCCEYSKFSGSWVWMEWGKQTEEIWNGTTPVSNISPWCFPEINIDFSILKKERRMESGGSGN